MSENTANNRPVKKDKIKIIVATIWFVVIIFSLRIILALYDFTVTNYDTNARAASTAQWRLITYSSSRGEIFDINGNPLASNTYDYTVVCSPKEIQSDTQTRTDIINNFSTILGLEVSYLDGIIPVDPEDETDERNSVVGMDLARNVTQEAQEQLAAYVDEYDIGGISYVAVPQRYYNYGRFLSQVLGFASNDGTGVKGVYGLEAYYNDVLSGTNGYRYSEVDFKTDGVLPYEAATMEEAVDGNDLILNIDMNVQRIAEEAARSAYEQYSPRDGICAIVMNPNTGAVLAMVSLPDFDLNEPRSMPYGMTETEWNAMSSEERTNYLMGSVWRNRCISDTYEPGSTFKALTTGIALEENLTSENEYFSDAPIAVSDIDTISCWMQKSYGYNHGTESLVEAFENSCNPIFVQLAYRIGVTKYYEYVHMFGFYEETGIDLPAEGVGIFHTDPSTIDMASLSFGESSTVTPIQLLNSYCAIINGGNLMVPHIVNRIEDSDGNIVDEIEPEVIRTIFSESTCARVRAMMEAVVNDGTGAAGRVPGYSVAGKTSTSTIENGELAGAHVLSFSCYAPSYDPQIAVLVVINKPADNSVGSSSAASTAAKIVEGTLTYMGVERVFSEDEYDDMTVKYYVQEVTGLQASEASSKISANGISALYGTADMTSDSVIGFTYPDSTYSLYSTGIVVMYPEGATQDDLLMTTVPNLRGKSAMECIEALRDANLNCDITGEITGVCNEQSLEYTEEVQAGTVVTVNLVPESEITPSPTPVPFDEGYDEEGNITETTVDDAVADATETSETEPDEMSYNFECLPLHRDDIVCLVET